MVLRMYGAHEVDARRAPEYNRIVHDLAQRAGLPMPRVYVTDSAQPNAFATGRSPSHAAVCASTGLIQALSPEELTGVIAHELSHIKNRDTLTMTVAATIGGAISMLAQYMRFGMMFGGSRDQRGGGLSWIGGEGERRYGSSEDVRHSQRQGDRAAEGRRLTSMSRMQ